MDLPELNQTSDFIRIPKVLHSSDTKKMFDTCLVCGLYLLDNGMPYMIEKAVRQIPEMKVKEVIFEYAMCMHCAAQMNASLSEESRERINQYFAFHTDLSSRRNKLLENKTRKIQPWINRCVIKDTPITKSKEYQIVAQCDGKQLLLTHTPFAISFEAMDEMANLLSAQSLGEIDDFMGKFFTGPPEVSEILKRRLVLL